MASDPEGASLSVTETLDQTVTRSLTAPSGSTLRFEAVYDSLSFLKLANGRPRAAGDCQRRDGLRRL